MKRPIFLYVKSQKIELEKYKDLTKKLSKYIKDKELCIDATKDIVNYFEEACTLY